MEKNIPPSSDWELRIDTLWDRIADYQPDDFIRAMDSLTEELSPDHSRALFERASAFDSTGHSDRAVPLYQKAISKGLDDSLRRRAVIQMASSMRNLGQVEESAKLLREELEKGQDELDDAVRAFLALTLADSGKEREALSLVLKALGPRLPRNQKSVVNYAKLLLEED